MRSSKKRQSRSLTEKKVKISPSVFVLIDKGVRISDPASVFIGSDVRAERIAAGVVIHPGCRIYGPETSIGPGCEIGREAPTTIENCNLGKSVYVGGGYCSGSIFLDGVSLGSGAHVRPGTILEEYSGVGHSVGLKQTILFPFVKAGSLINFCDAIMAGGTGPNEHSEIGSSYVHFNLTPRGDKATASIFGNVPEGVMIDKPPVFLGGQGGVVGPVRVAFGTVVPAGTILRRDILKPGAASTRKAGNNDNLSIDKFYSKISSRVLANCINYIAQLRALEAWYINVRTKLMSQDFWSSACCEGGIKALKLLIKERISRLDELVAKLERSLIKNSDFVDLPKAEAKEIRLFLEKWPKLSVDLSAPLEVILSGDRHPFPITNFVSRTADYIGSIKTLDEVSKKAAIKWLESLVEAINEKYRNL